MRRDTKLTAYHLDSFVRVYKDARAIYLDLPEAVRPIDPCVRLENRGSDDDTPQWALTSQLHSAEYSVLTFDLEAFDMFFSESYGDASFVPSLEDMRDFASLDETLR